MSKKPKKKPVEFESIDDAASMLPPWLADDVATLVTSKKVYLLNHALIGERVRARRIAAQISMRNLARWMGVSHTYMQHLETGQRAWNKSRLQDATDILDMMGSPAPDLSTSTKADDE